MRADPPSTLAPCCLVRVPAFPVADALPLLSGDARPEAARAVAERWIASERALAALHEASPVFAAQLREHGLADPLAVETVVKYLLRGTLRCTPFGLFTRVSAARYTDRASTQWLEEPIEPSVCVRRRDDTALYASPFIARPRGQRLLLQSTRAKADVRSIRSAPAVVQTLEGVHAAVRPGAVFGALTRSGLLAEYVGHRGGLERRGEACDRPAVVTELIEPVMRTLPRAVGEQMHARAKLLRSLGVPALAQLMGERYKELFRERFSSEWVPLTDAADRVVSGLAFPSETSAPKAHVELSESDRTSWLAALVQRAARTGAPGQPGTIEVAADELRAQRIGRDIPEIAEGFDVGALLVAESPAALADERFTLYPCALTATSAPFMVAGRFLWGLPDQYREQIFELQRGVAERDEQLHAEMVYLPGPSHEFVATARHAWPAELVINGPPTEPGRRYLRLSDVVVALREDRFIFALCDGTPLRLHHGHMWNVKLAPQEVRLARELAILDRPVPIFSWGALARAPVLPRLSCEGHVFALAQWNAPKPSDASALGRWLDAAAVPALVSIVDEDSHARTLVHRGTAWGQRMLVRAARRARRFLQLEEAPWASRLAPGAVVIEVTSSVLLDDAAGESQAARGEAARRLAIRNEAVRGAAVPGEAARAPRRVAVPDHGDWTDWTYYRVFADPLFQRDLVKQLRTRFAGTPWHYVRYAVDVRDELRFRYVGEPARELVRLALACGAGDVETALFRPEVGRYGGPVAFAEALRFFAWDSDAAARQWADAPDHDALLVACARDVAATVLAVLPGDAAVRWCAGHRPKVPAAAIDVKPQVRRLRAHEELHAPIDPYPAAEILARVAAASGEIRTVLPALVHMQCNRRLGTSWNYERIAVALAESIVYRAKERA